MNILWVVAALIAHVLIFYAVLQDVESRNQGTVAHILVILVITAMLALAIWFLLLAPLMFKG